MTKLNESEMRQALKDLYPYVVRYLDHLKSGTSRQEIVEEIEGQIRLDAARQMARGEEPIINVPLHHPDLIDQVLSMMNRP